MRYKITLSRLFDFCWLLYIVGIIVLFVLLLRRFNDRAKADPLLGTHASEVRIANAQKLENEFDKAKYKYEHQLQDLKINYFFDTGENTTTTQPTTQPVRQVWLEGEWANVVSDLELKKLKSFLKGTFKAHDFKFDDFSVCHQYGDTEICVRVQNTDIN